MGWLEDAERRLIAFNSTAREVKAFGQPPRPLDPEDIGDWRKSQASRTPVKSRADIIARVSLANPVRWARLNREYRWLQKQAVKHGLSPEDARFLL